jgi:hypothetical protein
MPVTKQGRFVTTSPEELNAWLGRESGKPVHVGTPEEDLAAELKRGIAFLRDKKTRGEVNRRASLNGLRILCAIS